jgi:hypothetical protein
MKALIPRHRAFVLAYFDTDPPSATEAARLAGYQDHPLSKDPHANKGAIRVTATRLMQREDIKAALVEEARRRLAWDLPVRIRTVAKIANNDQHKDQLKANLALLNRGGLPDVREVAHTHTVTLTDAEKWAKIREICEKHGLPMPEGAPVTVEAEYVEVNTTGKVVIDGDEY